MSGNEKQQPPANPAAPQGQQYFPPPPPGPPPIHPSQAPPPKHPDETPIPDYEIPGYNPAQPQFAPPPTADDEDIYNATPTDEHPPKWGHGHHQHQEGDGEGGKKKSHRLSAFGAAFSSKVAGPVNALAHKFGAEGFLPESLDKECEKAARILKGFCKDGIYNETVPPNAAVTTTGPSTTTATPNAPAIEEPPSSPSNKGKKGRVLLTIPSKVIARAQGLAIFTAVRLGFQATGSSGSGILLARLPDGSWSPPSGIQITSIGAGFVAGVDIYDCVIVINTREALEMFTKTRLSLGSDLAVTAGPFGAGGALDWGVPARQREAERRELEGKGKGKAGEQHPAATTLSPPPLSADNTRFQTGPVPEAQQGMGEEDAKEKAKRERRPSPFREAIKKPVYSYVKSRGLFAGVQIDGTVIAEREGANAKFYGQPVPVAKILKGEVPARGPPGMWPDAAKGLFEVLKGAEGWRGQQQGRPVSPVSPGLVGDIRTGAVPHSGAAAGTGTPPSYGPPAGTGAPPSTWVPPPPTGVPDVTAGMQNLSVGSSSAAGAGPSTGPSYPPSPTDAASAKAAEAAAEVAHSEHLPPPPPMYSELHGDQDLPPAYVEDERYPHAGQDSKTGRH
ncbi:hypothetical protein C8A03DRAFT_34868 [Achaetomium macrosporum]|uniref:Ysc84 actin-binding domain-containing protein n=1 Tax=Achaetomium macrosporum TaxID=79813 RepID=A0AAN7C8Y4_9PEZI|nr:hypothetical protein C8A03DRAFT_34868 [Achaetomium macrosporum]